MKDPRVFVREAENVDLTKLEKEESASLTFNPIVNYLERCSSKGYARWGNYGFVKTSYNYV